MIGLRLLFLLSKKASWSNYCFLSSLSFLRMEFLIRKTLEIWQVSGLVRVSWILGRRLEQKLSLFLVRCRKHSIIINNKQINHNSIVQKKIYEKIWEIRIVKLWIIITYMFFSLTNSEKILEVSSPIYSPLET
jgi:hypothetical protein